MAVWIRSGRVRFRHVSSRPLLAASPASQPGQGWIQVCVKEPDTFTCKLASVSSPLSSSSSSYLRPGRGRIFLPLASDLGSGQQTWHNVRSGAGAGLRALGTPLPRNLGVCPAGSGHRGQAVVHRTAPHDGLGTWAGWQLCPPCSWTTGGEQGLWLCPHYAGTYFCWHRLTSGQCKPGFLTNDLKQSRASRGRVGRDVPGIQNSFLSFVGIITACVEENGGAFTVFSLIFLLLLSL